MDYLSNPEQEEIWEAQKHAAKQRHDKATEKRRELAQEYLAGHLTKKKSWPPWVWYDILAEAARIDQQRVHARLEAERRKKAHEAKLLRGL